MAIDLRLEERTQNRVIDSLVTRGDISELNPQERAHYYIAFCEQLGLNAASNPLAILRLNGKEVLYPTRGATDQLAAIHRLNREVIEGPEVRDFGGTKLLYCKVRVTHPNGRVETAIATLPGRVDENSLMKLETKAKRRGTLSILGLGMLDETEIEAIPASAKEPAAPINLGALEQQAAPKASLADQYKRQLEALESPSIWSCAGIWLEWELQLREEYSSEELHDLQMVAKGFAPDATSMQAWKWACEVLRASAEDELVRDSLAAFQHASEGGELVVSWKSKSAALKSLTAAVQKLCWELHWRGYGRVTNASKPQEAFKKALGEQPPPDGTNGDKAKSAAANAEGSQASTTSSAAPQASAAQEWRKEARKKTNFTHLVNSFVAHEGEFGSEWEDCWTTAIIRAGELGYGAMSLEYAVKQRKAERAKDLAEARKTNVVALRKKAA